MSKRIAFLCDAGQGIGLGHYSRCSSLNNYFINSGLQSTIFCYLGGGIEYDINPKDINWYKSECLYELAKDYNVAVVDSYRVGQSFFVTANNLFDKLVVLDDYGRLRDFKAELIINPNIFGDTIKYANLSIGGSEYVILRNSFIKNKGKNPIRDNLKNILITLGGSDYRKLISRFLKVFQDLPFQFTVVSGSEKYAAELSQNLNYENTSVLGFINESTMYSLMVESDLCISACGQTLHELAFTGCPTLGIIIDEDQKLNGQSYFDLGFLYKIYNWDENNLTKKLIGAMNSLKDPQIRFQLSEIGKSLVDGMGVQRIYEKIKLL